MTIDREKTVMLFIIDDGKILLLKRKNTWFGSGQFAPPGGLVDANETPAAAAVRELSEETGLHVTVDSLKLICTTETTGNGRAFLNYYYYTTSYSGELANLETSQHDSLDWYKITDLPTEVMSLVPEVLAKIDT